LIATREDRGYTTRQIAEVVGIPGGQVRSLVREGLLDPERGPGGELRFTFRDLVLLRTTKELRAAGVSPRRVRRALRKLQHDLEHGGSLSQVRIEAAGDRVVVRDAAGLWEPESGQVELDFPGEFTGREPESEGGGVAAIGTASSDRAPEGPLESPASGTADEWYNLGIDLEATAPDEALKAYESALAIRPDHADARTNRGRLLHERGDVEAAEACYRAALDAEPHNALAAFNLGVALEDLGRPAAAARAYERALHADPGLASAHFNLARLCEREGREDAALGHLSDYRRLTQGRA
jgi:tetratricopeptide (TPR) repeat protein